MKTGTTYYVDGYSKKAKDTNDGLSWDKPFKTFPAALAASCKQYNTKLKKGSKKHE